MIVPPAAWAGGVSDDVLRAFFAEIFMAIYTGLSALFQWLYPLRDNIHEGHFRMSRTSSQLRGEDSNPGMRKKACVSHRNLVRDRVYREGMGSIMGTYLV